MQDTATHELTVYLTEAACSCGFYTVLYTVAEREALTSCPREVREDPTVVITNATLADAQQIADTVNTAVREGLTVTVDYARTVSTLFSGPPRPGSGSPAVVWYGSGSVSIETAAKKPGRTFPVYVKQGETVTLQFHA